MAYRSTIIATGMHVPETVLSNAHLERILDTTDEWIVSRTGIEERRVSLNGLPAVMGTKAARDLLARSHLAASKINALICTTNSSNYIFPPTASLVAGELALPRRTSVFDIGAGCSAFLVALQTAAGFVESGRCEYVLVLAVEKMTSIVDYTDRRTCVLFGDGAGCCLVGRATEASTGLAHFLFYQDNKNFTSLYLSNGNYRDFKSLETINKETPPRWHYLSQQGAYVFKIAVESMAEAVMDIITESGLSIEEVDWVVPHQANLRIITAIADRLDITEEKMLINVEKYGNTSSASIPICLAEFEHKLKRGDNVILVAFGTGYIAAAVHVVWGYDTPLKHHG